MKLTEAIQLTESSLSHLPHLLKNVTDPMGIGSIPINTNIDYLGIKVKMQPDNFLKLASSLNGREKHKTVDYLINHIEAGGKVAPPLLELRPSMYDSGDERDDVNPVVVSHEGRHRMLALSYLYGGDIFVDVHIIIRGFRRHEITDEMIERLNKMGITNQERSREVLFTIRDPK